MLEQTNLRRGMHRLIAEIEMPFLATSVSLEILQCTKHFAKVGFRNETIRLSRGPSQWDNYNEAIYFFDDIWAASHPNLAKSLLYSGCEGMSVFKIPNRSCQ